MAKNDVDVAHIKVVENAAGALWPMLRRQARRPFVLEITGTPKAGKTTLIGMLDSFLRECGWRVQVLKERAGECPLPMKGHFFFNTWTTGTMLAELIDAVDREHDIVILDRGIFDALIWLELQKKQGQISKDEHEAFDRFVRIDRWRKLVDRVCVIDLDPAVAMTRENVGRIVPRRGSVMNPERLGEFNACLRDLRRDRRDDFRFVEIKNDLGPKEGALQLIEGVLDAARSWCDPEIAVLPAATARELLPSKSTPWSPEIGQRLMAAIEYRQRSTVESSKDWVQVLACGAQTHSGEVFLVVRRRRRDDVHLQRDNSAQIWRGCHVSKPEGPIDVDHLCNQLKERLRQDLHLGELVARPEPKGIVWTPDSADEHKHLGVVFSVSVPDNVAEWLDEKQFKTNGRGHMLESSFVKPAELEADTEATGGYKLEEWSQLILAAGWLP